MTTDAVIERRAHWMLYLLPAAIHVVLLVHGCITQRPLELGRLDIVGILLLLAYVLGGLLITINRTRTFRLISVVYPVLLGLVLVEFLGRASDPHIPVDQWLPHYPGQTVLELKEAIPGEDVRAVFTVNRYGVRAPDFKLPAGKAVLCIGGSTTECRAVTDVESWPWQLHERLADQGVVVGNAGRSGHFMPNHTYQVENYTFIKDFQLVLILAGINDLGRAFREDYDQRMARIEGDSLLFNEKVGGLYYRRLWMVRRFKEWRSIRQQINQGSVVENYDQKIADIRAARQRKLAAGGLDALPDDFDSSLARYRSDIRTLISAAKVQGVVPVLMTQPTTWQSPMPPELEELLCVQTRTEAYRTPVLEEAIGRFNRVLIDTAEAEGVLVIDLAAEVPKTLEMMYDDCHFKPAGCAKAAEVIARQLKPLLGSLK